MSKEVIENDCCTSHAAKKQKHETKSLLSSPLLLSPTRKERKSSLNTDDVSFSLFAGSFDSFGNGGNFLNAFDVRQTLSPARPGGCEIHITNLKGLEDQEYDDSIGNLTPIKVVPPRRSSNALRNHPIEADTPVQNSNWEDFEQEFSNPFFVLKTVRKAFDNCKYLLPCLQGIDTCDVNMSSFGPFRHYQGKENDIDWTLATQRVEAAVCAFGGTLRPKQTRQTQSIFRLKGVDKRLDYEMRFHTRYRLNGSRISWDVEEDPPISSTEDDDRDNSVDERTKRSSNLSKGLWVEARWDDLAKSSKYHCKLCGQPKQNHDCPYRTALQRSIGVMVYPVAHSFRADEPGFIAPPLTQMNNFVSYDSDQAGFEPSKEVTVVRSLPESVTPDSRLTNYQSPQSSLSLHSEEGASKDRKRAHPETEKGAKLPPGIVNLRPEQYRGITPNADDAVSYQYMVVPLTFAERKRLSDSLFYLSRQIPTMTSECAMVLRMARANNEWDLAIAELLTQVVVGFYCAEGDSQLIGLHQYLLRSFGVSC